MEKEKHGSVWLKSRFECGWAPNTNNEYITARNALLKYVWKNFKDEVWLDRWDYPSWDEINGKSISTPRMMWDEGGRLQIKGNSQSVYIGGSFYVTVRLKSGVKTESSKYDMNGEKGWRIGW